MRHISRPVWLFIATFIALLLPNVWLSIVEPMTVGARITNIVLPGAAYLLLLTLSRNPARMVWATFPLLFLSAFQLVLLYLYGHSIIAVDMFLNLVTTNTAEVSELLGSLLPAVGGVAVIFLPILYFGAVRFRRKDYALDPGTVHRVHVAGTGWLLAGVISMCLSYLAGGYRAKDDLYPVNVCYNIWLAVDRTGRTARYAETSRDFTFEAVATHPADRREVYVMVIGETARAENFGLYGYTRDTTPRLAAVDGLVAYPQAYTQSNTTHKSVPMLMSAATAEDYDRIYREKGIISAFREAGFHTVFISNQRPNHSFIDIFGEEADKWRFLKEELPAGANIHDGEMLAEVDRVLAEGRGKVLIVLHTYGSHFEYRERYPREMAHFLPDDAVEASAANRECLLNAYDNTILYTDSVLDALIGRLHASGADAGMLYTSDHGENIYDDGSGLFLHASPRPSIHELHVPLLVWLSDSYRAGHPEVAEALQGHRGERVITSASVFHTMLGMAGIATPVRCDSLSLASPAYRPGPYNYLTDRNIPMPVYSLKSLQFKELK